MRPIRILPGVRSPLRSADHLDLVVVRENVEGEYSEVGGRMYRGRPEEMAVQESVFTRIGITRVAEYAATLAESRARRVVSATKSNGIIHSMPFWDEVVADVFAYSPRCCPGKGTHRCPGRPSGAATGHPRRCCRLQPVRRHPVRPGGSGGRFHRRRPQREPQPARRSPIDVRTGPWSAPDIAGKGIANPVGQMWAAAMMLDHLGQPAAAAQLTTAFEDTLAAGVRTGDLGGTATTKDFTTEVIAAARAHESNTSGNRDPLELGSPSPKLKIQPHRSLDPVIRGTSR